MKSKTVGKLGCVALLSLSTQAFSQNAAVTSEKAGHPTYEPDTLLLGAKLGVFNVETVDDLILGYGAFADYALGSNFLVGGTLDYWSRTSASIDVNRVQINDLALGANGKVVFTDVKVPFRPYALAGVAVHRFEVNTGDATGDRIDKLKDVSQEAAAKFGIDLGGGVMYRVQQAVDIAGEVRWRKLSDTSADLDQIAFTGGVSYSL